MLTIQTQTAQKLSTHQQAFNRNVKKLESLQQDIVRLTQKLSDTMRDYQQNVVPLMEDKRAATRNLMVLLYGFLQRPNYLRPQEKRALKGFMQNLMNGYLDFNAPDPDVEIRKIFQTIFGTTFEEAKKAAFDKVRKGMKSMFDMMGVDVDINGFNQNMSEEEMARRMHEMKSKMRNQEAAKRQRASSSTKKETKQQVKERLAKEARDKSMSTIYKGLAKILHPDLEQDESKKGEKEELMKEVTSAYQNKDLHTLLKLELRILHSDEPHLDKLSNEKIKAYNELLREQIEELDIQKQQLPEHSRYLPLHQFVDAPFQLFNFTFSRTLKEIKHALTKAQKTFATLHGNEKNADAELKSLLKAWQHSEEKDRQRDMENMRHLGLYK